MSALRLYTSGSSVFVSGIWESIFKSLGTNFGPLGVNFRHLGVNLGSEVKFFASVSPV